MGHKFKQEVLLVFYYAGHGCMKKKQYIVLNEDDIDKIFWPSEENLRVIGRMCGPSVKIFAVNDCCREDYSDLKERLMTDEEKDK